MQTVWKQELEELLVDQSFPLDHLHDHLPTENLLSDQLQTNSFYIEKNNNNKLDHNQLQEEKVPDREL